MTRDQPSADAQERSHGKHYANQAYRACLEGRADKNQQQSAASQIILLHAIKGRLVDALSALVSAVEADHRCQGIDPRSVVAAHTFIALAMKDADAILKATSGAT